MLLTSPSSLLQLPPLKSLKISSPFLYGSTPVRLLNKPSSSLSPSNPSPPSFLPPIRAMKSLQGRVVCATNDKTVAVEVVRLAPHPKYKRRVRKKKKFQAHDPENRFKVGDFVQLEKSKPISKTKAFIAIPVTAKNAPKSTEALPQELGIPLESEKSE
ncbi:PREDICTED: 30S ribosomal protein S17, chloroplastic [Nelumbo nucifera]|uniref:Small ribosomal subunit protein uS17c n=1 Tax=Nelumbo nucifera TaxID=4432 RepID=A0A1U7ZQA3_NELNU|nr:PREDICTED: 30S ribosomal protein S17, chloroplastic [Nelumbo nucifera]